MRHFFDYFQIVGLALFLGLCTGKALYLYLRKGIKPITIGIHHPKRVRGIIELASFAVVAIWAFEVLFSTLPLDFHLFPSLVYLPLIDSKISRFAGVAAIILSFFILTRAMIALGNSWRLGIDEKKPGALVTKGIYAMSRNPIYVFFNLYFVGTFLINGVLVFLIFAVLLAVTLHCLIREEEKALLKIHGAAYRRYCAETGRYITR
jgi:protein-S-isoprenylcysteine O-methyltransferase Ste14